jgi:acyl carrier protein
MITSEQIEGVILSALEALNQERDGSRRIDVSPATALFGVDATIDSLEFVSVITDVETTLNVQYGLDISLADDRAMTRAVSPYSTAAALRDYVLELVSEP